MKLRIGLLASNWHPIPGNENLTYAPGALIAELADRLVERGHEVTLFAPLGTKTKAKLVDEGLRSPREDFPNLPQDDLALYVMIERGYELMLITKAFEMAKEGAFDLIHAHKITIEPFFSSFIETPLLITQHHSYLQTVNGITTPADLAKLKKYKDTIHYIGISEYMTSEVDLNYAGVVYNGTDIERYSFNPSSDRSGLLFVGRMIHRKGPDIAIETAKALGVPIDVMGDRRFRKENLSYWEEIQKDLENELVIYHDYVPPEETVQFYQNAKVTLFPVRIPEPFGLVMIESMACGTPVVGFDMGAVREVIEDGVTGFVVKPGDTAGFTAAVKKIYEMPEAEYKEMQLACRQRVEQLFTLDRMVSGYEEVYKKIIQRDN